MLFPIRLIYFPLTWSHLQYEYHLPIYLFASYNPKFGSQGFLVIGRCQCLSVCEKMCEDLARNIDRGTVRACVSRWCPSMPSKRTRQIHFQNLHSEQWWPLVLFSFLKLVSTVFIAAFLELDVTCRYQQSITECYDFSVLFFWRLGKQNWSIRSVSVKEILIHEARRYFI